MLPGTSDLHSVAMVSVERPLDLAKSSFSNVVDFEEISFSVLKIILKNISEIVYKL